MFDEYGPHGAEEEREELWTDLSEIPEIGRASGRERV